MALGAIILRSSRTKYPPGVYTAPLTSTVGGAVPYPKPAHTVHGMDNEDRKLHDLLAALGVAPPSLALVSLKSWDQQAAIHNGRPGGTLTIDYTYEQPLAFTAAERKEIALDALARIRAFLASEDECCGGGCGR